MKRIDLHVHTNISDGSETPENTVAQASALGLCAIAVTDHDTVSGVKAAAAAGKLCGVEVVAGLELGCEWYGREIHMLGYDIDPDSAELCTELERRVSDRDERNRRMCENMSRDGIAIDLDEITRQHPGSIIGRPHFALRLVEEGLAESVQDAFKRYLDPGQKYYLRRHFLSLEEGARLIRSAGGKPVIAHPMQYRLSEDGMAELLSRAERADVAGLECFYSGYDEKTTAYLLSLAKRHGFCPTCGSDWHGSHKPHIKMGSGINGELCGDISLLQALRAHG